jgi:glycosyltransferase involved in cell wall biosynthesis
MKAPPSSVCLLFRQPGRFFSIERIFQELSPILAQSLSVRITEMKYSRVTIRNILANIRQAKKCSADIYHITGDVHYVVLGLPTRRTLLTIHDCVFLYAASGLKRRLLKWLLLDMPVHRSGLVTTISEATRQDILNFTGCSPQKVVVIPDPVSDSIRYSPADFRTEEPVILFMGTTDNKNLLRVAQALTGIRCRLEIVGQLNADQKQALKDQAIRYNQHSGLSDEAVAAAYVNADLVLFPSTFEGFGLPIVEGQKSGRPVITSDLSPMKEVAGGAAHLVDPYNVDSIREGVLSVIQQPDYRQQLVEKGLANVRRFSTTAIAAQYLECYNKLANQ